MKKLLFVANSATKYKLLFNNLSYSGFFIPKIFNSQFTTTSSTLLPKRRKDSAKDYESKVEWFDRVSKIKLTDQSDEKEALNEDLALIKPSIEAQSQLSKGILPSIELDKLFWSLKDNYPAFFDDEELQDSTSKLNKILQVREYLISEIKSNEKETVRLQGYIDRVLSGEEVMPASRTEIYRGEPFSDSEEEEDESLSKPKAKKAKASTPIFERARSAFKSLLPKEESSSRPIIERGESSRSAAVVGESATISEAYSRAIIEGGQSSKRKFDSISDKDPAEIAESSKKVHQTPGDYIDSLPESPYSFMDDLD